MYRLVKLLKYKVMTDDVVGFVGGVAGFILGKETGVFKFYSVCGDIGLFILVTVSAGLLGYVGKVLGSLLIKGIKSIFEKRGK